MIFRNLFCVLLAFAGLLAGTTIRIPAALSSPDNGETEDVRLILRNVENRSLQVRISLEGQSGGEEAAGTDLLLDPGATITLNRVLSDSLKLAGAAGTLRLESDGRLQAHAERWLPGAQGGKGMALPVIDESSTAEAGEALDLPYLPSTSDLASSIWITQLSEATAADLLLFDDQGKQLLRRRIDIAGTTRLRLTELLEAPAALCRAQLRIVSGSASMMAEVEIASSGDRFGYPGINLESASRDQILAPAVSMPVGGGMATTKIVLFNPYRVATSVSLLAGSQRTTVSVAPSTVLEIPDVLGARFSGTKSAVLRAVSGMGFYALGITEFRPAPDSPQVLAGARAFRDQDAMAEAESVLLIPPVRTSEDLAFLSLDSQADEVLARLELNGPDGLPTGTEQWLTVPANSLMMSPLSEAMPGAASGERPFSLMLASGRVSAALFEFLPGSYDPLWRPALPVPEAVDTTCTPPGILTWEPSVYTLDKPGQVTLTWETGGADAVRIEPEIGEVEASGSRTFELDATRTYRLWASNACGEAEIPVTVAVGAPSLASVVAGLPGTQKQAGQPGELLTFEFANLAEPDSIQDILLQTADKFEVPLRILERGSEGQIYALVPYVTDGPNDTQVTGAVSFLPVFRNGTRGTARPFTIEASRYDGDAVQGFQALLDGAQRTLEQNLASMKAIGYAAAEADAAAARSALQDLRSLVSRIGITGQATMALDKLPDSDPAAMRATIRREHLAVLLAYNRNAGQAWRAILGLPADATVQQAAERMDEIARERGAAEPTRDAGTCLDRKLNGMISICKANRARERLQDALANATTDFLADLHKDAPKGAEKARDYLIKKFISKSTQAMMKRYVTLLKMINISCIVDPLELKSFKVETIGRVIRYVPREQRSLQPKELMYSRDYDMYTPVLVKARLVPNIPTEELRNQLRSSELNGLKAAMKKVGYSDLEIAVYSKIYEELLQKDPLVDTLVKMAEGHNEKERLIQVGNCDLQHVYPKKNGPGVDGNPNLNYRRGRSVLWIYTKRPQGEDDYFIVGRRAGRSEDLCIVPRPDNFLFHADGEATELVRNTKDPCAFHERVKVKGRSARILATGTRSALPGLEVSRSYNDRVFVGPPDVTLSVVNASADAQIPPGLPPTTINVPRGVSIHDRDEPYVLQGGGGHSLALMNLTRTSDTSWQVDLEARSYQEPNEDAAGFRTFTFWPAFSMINLSIGVTDPSRFGSHRLTLQGETSSQQSPWCAMFVRLSASGESVSQGSPSSIGPSVPNPPISLKLVDNKVTSPASVFIRMSAHGLGFSGPFVANSTACRGKATIRIEEVKDEEGDSGQ